MGWKAFVVFAAEEQGYFGTMPVHDPERADKIREQLGLIGFERKGPVVLESVMNPKRGQLVIGAYPRGVAICHRDAPGCFFDDRSHRKISGSAGGFARFKDNLLALYPTGEVTAIVLHSVVNLWGYSVYNNGRLLRSAAGASDDGIIVDEGAPLPEESRILATCPIDSIDEEGVGEELVFDVSTRMFGTRIDEIDNLALPMTEYTRHGLLRSLIGRLRSR
jgi:hypothetical protein